MVLERQGESRLAAQAAGLLRLRQGTEHVRSTGRTPCPRPSTISGTPNSSRRPSCTRTRSTRRTTRAARRSSPLQCCARRSSGSCWCSTLREVLRDPSVRRCAMVDIDGQVVELAKQYLPEWSAGAFDDPRARVIIGDALAFLKDDRDHYGVVISDLTEPLPDSPSFPLFNGEVFRDIKARLAPGGVYVLQASTAGFHNMALHAKMARSLRAHFTHVRSFYTHVPAFDNDWAFIACSDQSDVAALEPALIDAYTGTLRGENFFYDAQTHRRLFALPLYLRREQPPV